MRRLHSRLAAVALAALAVACSDSTNRSLLTDPGASKKATSDIVPGTCTSYGGLTALIDTVFGAGSPNARSAKGKLDNLQRQLDKGAMTEAQAQAENIVSFVSAKAAEGLPGTHEQTQRLISNVLCYVGLTPDTFLIYPSDQPQVVKDPTGKAGVSLPSNPVDVPSILTIELLDPSGPSPLDTKLDKYPGYVHITFSGTLTSGAVVAVCPSASVPDDVRPRLRLGHQASAGFEITPPADGSFLDCGTTSSAKGGFLSGIASFFLPKALYARELSLGGVGGLASEFSPFGPVDTEVSFAGGVGGLASEFTPPPMDRVSGSSVLSRSKALRRLTRPGSGMTTGTVIDGACTVVDAVVGNALEPECRPVVTLTTHLGTILNDVPVNWAIGLGGGVIAPQATTTTACGETFGATVSMVTNSVGKAAVCWTLGQTEGTNTVVATPATGGDAPAGVRFSTSSITFTANATRITPTANAVGESVTFDGQAHPGSGTCSNSLTPSLTYSSGAAPINVGTYTLTVTCGGSGIYNSATSTATISISAASTNVAINCPTSVTYTGSSVTPCTASVSGPSLSQSLNVTYSPSPVVGVGSYLASATYAGGGNYLGSSNSRSFSVTRATATATAGSATMLLGGPVPSIPCAVTGLLGGDAGTVTCTTSVPSTLVAGNNTTTPVVSPANPANYAMQLVTGKLAVRYVQNGCFASPVYSSLPPTKSYQKKGSNLPIKCTLQNALGAAVNNAIGDVQIFDQGINGTSSPVLVFSKANAFTVSNGNYSYGFDTSPASLLTSHYFRVVATWNDGSTTTGFFYLK